jgi:hypothetical protein
MAHRHRRFPESRFDHRGYGIPDGGRDFGCCEHIANAERRIPDLFPAHLLETLAMELEVDFADKPCLRHEIPVEARIDADRIGDPKALACQPGQG